MENFSLESVINKQRYTNDRSELGYSKFYKPSRRKQTIFIKSNNT